MRATDGKGRLLSLRRRLVVGLAASGAAIAALALASVAGAATVGFETDPPICGGAPGAPPPNCQTIHYFAAAGENNDLTVARNASTNDTTFTEIGGVALTANSVPGCTPLSAHAVRCHPGDTAIDLELGDGNDTVRLSGPLGPDCSHVPNLLGGCVQVVGGPGLDLLDASDATGDGAFGHGVRLLGGDGSDTLLGGTGGDLLVGGRDGDTMSGGAGSDRASYADHATGVVATLDGARNDGTPGIDGGTTTGADQIDTNVEQLEGGKGNDHLVGNPGNNLLVGGGGSDRLEGLDGNDLLESNDGVADTVLCGAGADKALVDLKDGPAGFRDCEGVSQAAVDQHPTIDIRDRSLRLHRARHGRPTVRVHLHCPRALHRGCRGVLEISEVPGSGKRAAIIGRKHYAKVARGGSAKVAVPINASSARAARRKGHITVRVDARERDSDGMPKHSLRTMRLRA